MVDVAPTLPDGVAQLINVVATLLNVAGQLINVVAALINVVARLINRIGQLINIVAKLPNFAAKLPDGGAKLSNGAGSSTNFPPKLPRERRLAGRFVDRNLPPSSSWRIHFYFSFKDLQRIQRLIVKFFTSGIVYAKLPPKDSDHGEEPEFTVCNKKGRPQQQE